MFNFGVCECATFTVFEPFLGGLVAADVEVPGDFGDVAEVLSFVYEHIPKLEVRNEGGYFGDAAEVLSFVYEYTALIGRCFFE
jgi:hypothetical protein